MIGSALLLSTDISSGRRDSGAGVRSSHGDRPDPAKGTSGRRRGGSTAGVLIVSQLLAGVGVASGVAVGGLLAEQMTGTTAFAGFAQTSSVLGAGIWAIPLARLAGARAGAGGWPSATRLATVGVLLIFLRP